MNLFYKIMAIVLDIVILVIGLYGIFHSHQNISAFCIVTGATLLLFDIQFIKEDK